MATEADPPGVVLSRRCSIGESRRAHRRSTEDVGSLKLRSDAQTAPQRLEEPVLHFRYRREAPSEIAKSPLAARVAPIPAERALAGFRRALGPPLRFESPGQRQPRSRRRVRL